MTRRPHICGLAATLGFGVLLLIGAGARAQSGAHVFGTVVDPAGKGLPNAIVTLKSADTSAQAMTDSAGHFSFSSVPTGLYDLRAEVQGFWSLTFESVPITSGDIGPLTVEMRLGMADCSTSTIAYLKGFTAEQNLRGVVALFPDVRLPNRKFSDVRLSLWSADATRSLQSLHPDASGTFQMRDLEPGKYRLLALLTGYAQVWSESFEVSRTDLTRVELTLVKNGEAMHCE